MERPVDTSIASHLLAAINVLPPLRQEYPGSAESQTPNRPAPLEPSAATPEPYSSNNNSQYQQRQPERIPSTPHASQQYNADQQESHHEHAAQSHQDHHQQQQQQHHHDLSQNGNVGEQQQHHQDVEMMDAHSAGRAYPAILPSGVPVTPQQTAPTAPMANAAMQTPQNKNTARATQTSGGSTKTPNSNRRVRRKWTEEETNDLIRGCHIHGVGNWKKVLDDPRFHFNGRSSVDLKDRFRTCFPKEYRKSTNQAQQHVEGEEGTQENGEGPARKKGPNLRKVTKTELHHAEVLEKLGIGGNFPKVQRRERREFTPAEDERLLQGFTLYGASWSKIQTDAKLGLGHRRSTDLRDRFRNAFPERYEMAGFKARPRQRPKVTRSPAIPDASPAPANIDPALQSSNPSSSDPNGSNKQDSAALLMQSILGPEGSTWSGDATNTDQAPAPGSLALDPALNAGFEGIEQITEDFLAVAAQGEGEKGQSDLVRWEDMATHPIFELEPSMTSSGAQGVTVEKGRGEGEGRKRGAEESEEGGADDRNKRLRDQQTIE